MDHPKKREERNCKRSLRCPLCKASYVSLLHDIVSDSTYKIYDFSGEIKRRAEELAARHQVPPNPTYEYEWGTGRVWRATAEFQGVSRQTGVSIRGVEVEPDAPFRRRRRLYDLVRSGRGGIEVGGNVPWLEDGRVRAPLNLRHLVPWLQVELSAALTSSSEDFADLAKYVAGLLECENNETAGSRNGIFRGLRPFFRGPDLLISVFLARVAHKNLASHPLVAAAQAWADSKAASSSTSSSSRGNIETDLRHVVVAGRYGEHSGMNGTYRRSLHGTIDDRGAIIPAFIKEGPGKMRGGEEWKWVLRFYTPKMQWKIDFYPTVRHEDNCFAFVVSNARHPWDIKERWSVWEGLRRGWEIDNSLYVSKMRRRRSRSVMIDEASSRREKSSRRRQRNGERAAPHSDNIGSNRRVPREASKRERRHRWHSGQAEGSRRRPQDGFNGQVESKEESGSSRRRDSRRDIQPQDGFNTLVESQEESGSSSRKNSQRDNQQGSRQRGNSNTTTENLRKVELEIAKTKALLSLLKAKRRKKLSIKENEASKRQRS